VPYLNGIVIFSLVEMRSGLNGITDKEPYFIREPLQTGDEVLKIVGSGGTRGGLHPCAISLGSVCVELIEVDLEFVRLSEEIADGFGIFGDLGLEVVPDVLARGKSCYRWRRSESGSKF
jgi:hypothetical protein